MDDLRALLTFNRGLISKNALARVDLDRINGSSEIQTNWMPRVLGPMTFRPGFQYINDETASGALIPFVFSDTDTAILDLTPGVLKIREQGTSLVTRPGVIATVTNPNFTTNLSGWTANHSGGATATRTSNAELSLNGTGSGTARMYQTVTPDVSEYNVEHSLRIHITRGPVVLRIGSSVGTDDVFRQAVLRTGHHSLAFVPGGPFTIEFSSPLSYSVLIASCQMEAAGVVSLPTPWDTVEKCRLINFCANNDVMFCAGGGVRQRRISRREGRSWSISEYTPVNGPFDLRNTEQITITPSATTGAVTLTATRGVFRDEHIGSVFQLVHGSTYGSVYLTGVSSATSASGFVVRQLGTTTATDNWSESLWSDWLGWPTAVAIWEGRLWWFSSGRVFGSVSDEFENFDQQTEGDAGPIVKGFGTGNAQNPKWAVGGVRLLIGTDHAEFTIRSNAFREPVTPTNYNVIPDTSEGSLDVLAVALKNRVVFVDRSGQSVYEVSFESSTEVSSSIHLNVLTPDILDTGIVRMCSQRKPDERIWITRGDGKCAVLVRDPVEEMRAWVLIETDGVIEDVCSLPVRGQKEDDLFIKVKRIVEEQEVYYIERLALFSQCVGGSVNRQADSFVVGTGNVSGLGHLEGRTVVIWGDGLPRGTGVVSSGAVAGHTYANWCAGLTYEGTYKSGMLAWVVDSEFVFGALGEITHVSFVLADTHSSGLQFGPDFDNLDDLPALEDEAPVSGSVYPFYSKERIEFPGDVESDPRFCLKASAPKPASVLSATLYFKRAI